MKKEADQKKETDDSSGEISDVIQQARQGGAQLRGKLLESYRPYLRLIAEQKIGYRFRKRVDVTDVVQETFVEAWRDFDSFRGSTEAEFSAWLRQILVRNISNVFRDNMAAKRQITREQSLMSGGSGSATIMWDVPETRQRTPSWGAIRGESALRLATILETLPAMQREAIRLRHLEGWPLKQIADHMDRTTVATAGLIKRGLQNLRKRMNEQSWLS